MPLPDIPTSHRWIDGGAVVRYIGRGVTGPAADSTMWCWDRDTSLRVVDLYDQNGAAVTEIPVIDNTFFCAVPKTIAHPVFSVGSTGARFAGNDWQLLDDARNTVLGNDAAIAALVTPGSGSATEGVLNSTYVAVEEAGYDPARDGAKGDNATDDTAALQAALVKVRAAKGQMRLRPGATYLTTASLDPTGTKVIAHGATLRAKSGGAGFNLLAATDGFSIEGGTLDPNKAGRTDPGLGSGGGIRVSNVAGFSGVAVRDVAVLAGWQAGIQLDGNSGIVDPTNAPNGSATLSGVRITGTTLGVYALWLAGITVTDCTIEDTTSDGILDYMCRGMSVKGSTIRRAGGHSVISEYSRGARIIGNVSESPTQGGFVIGGGDDTLAAAVDFTVADNHSRAAAVHGIWIDTTKASTPAGGVVPCYGVVSGNTVSGSTQHGLYLNHSQWLTVVGNTLRGSGSAGILTMAKNVTLTGNVITGNSFGAYFAAAAVGYGEYVWSGNVNKGNTTQDWAFDANSVTGSTFDLSGTGAPAVAIPTGATGTYRRADGGAGTSFYVREAGAWVAK